jgi:hypothetical protein
VRIEIFEELINFGAGRQFTISKSPPMQSSKPINTYEKQEAVSKETASCFLEYQTYHLQLITDHFTNV